MKNGRCARTSSRSVREEVEDMDANGRRRGSDRGTGGTRKEGAEYGVRVKTGGGSSSVKK